MGREHIELTEKSGLLDLLEAVMADKGFTISDLLAQRGVHFCNFEHSTLHAKWKMSEGDVKLTQSIATP